jgi:hypothetical protein
MKDHPASEPTHAPRHLVGARFVPALCLAAMASFAACTGQIGGDDDGASTLGGGDDECVGCTESGLQVAPQTRFPRLSHRQWELTVADLFGLDEPTGLSATFAQDLQTTTFDNNFEKLSVPPALWQSYQTAAEDLALLVTADPTLLSRITPADLPVAEPDRGRTFVERFGERAYRRPLSNDEIDTLLAAYAQGPTAYPGDEPFAASVRVTIEAALQSPLFLYRGELGTEADGRGLIALSDWEVASRLSYALWDTMPDDALFDAARSGALATPEGLRAEVERLVDSPRAHETRVRFVDQLLKGDQAEHIEKSLELFPFFDAELGVELRLELARFAEHVLLEEDGGIAELLTSRTAFVTPRTAQVYGLDPATLPAADERGFSRVELDPAERSGVLTRGAFLAWKGTATEPDTILRGVFINRRILCQDLGDPPDEAIGAELPEGGTGRERVEALTGDGTCGQGCHSSFINPIGYAFEHYDAIGGYRTTDAGKPVDAASSFPFLEGERSFADAIELSDVLAESLQVHRCYAGFWVEHALGRARTEADEALVEQVAERSLAGASTRDLFVDILSSDVLRYRLREEAP